MTDVFPFPLTGFVVDDSPSPPLNAVDHAARTLSWLEHEASQLCNLPVADLVCVSIRSENGTCIPAVHRLSAVIRQLCAVYNLAEQYVHTPNLPPFEAV